MDIKTPTNREECLVLALLIRDELKKIRKIFDEVFERCERSVSTV